MNVNKSFDICNLWCNNFTELSQGQLRIDYWSRGHGSNNDLYAIIFAEGDVGQTQAVEA